MISRTWFGELPYNLVVAIALLLWAPSFVASVCSLTAFAILKTLHVLCLERIQKMSGVTIVRAIKGSTLVWAIILPGAHFLYKVSSNFINSRGGGGYPFFTKTKSPLAARPSSLPKNISHQWVHLFGRGSHHESNNNFMWFFQSLNGLHPLSKFSFWLYMGGSQVEEKRADGIPWWASD